MILFLIWGRRVIPVSLIRRMKSSALEAAGNRLLLQTLTAALMVENGVPVPPLISIMAGYAAYRCTCVMVARWFLTSVDLCRRCGTRSVVRLWIVCDL